MLFRLGDAPVVLALSWWVGAIAITVLYTPMVSQLLPGTNGLVAVGLAVGFTLLLGVSVLAHELGHCVMALRLGLPVRRLRLFLLGGISEMRTTLTRPRQEGLVAVAGPLVSIILALLFGAVLLVVPASGPLWLLTVQSALANAAVAAFNLLPGLPLDGGRMVRAAVWAVTGRRLSGTKVAVAGGGLVAVLLLLWALFRLAQGSGDRWLWLGVCVLTAWFVITGARSELLSEYQRTWPRDLVLADVARPIIQLPSEVPVSDTLGIVEEQGVLLVRADGIAVGLLDEVAAKHLAVNSPQAPAEGAAESITPDNVLLSTDAGADIADRVHATPNWQFLVVDAEGKPAAVLRRTDLRAAQERKKAKEHKKVPFVG